MISEFVDAIYVGCATDSEFVSPTCAMLSSLDDNGNIPEASVIVADFGLSMADRDALILSAGRLGPRLTFLPLERTSPEFPAVPAYDFPFPLLGRLVIPGQIRAKRARLVTIDSDMLVNFSLRPLFEMSMRGHPLAAIYDPITVREHYGREANHSYFNAGLMLMDVDAFNAGNYGDRAMRLLASYDHPPKWLDQDVLNELLENNWLTLDRRWNFFHAADRRQFNKEDYARADVIHFAGPKPWHGAPHAATWLYEHHARRAAEKREPGPINAGPRIDRVFAAQCYEVLLGREMESDAPYIDRASMSRSEFSEGMRLSPEFISEVAERLRDGTPFQAGRFEGKPSYVQRAFAADQLRVTPTTKRRLLGTRDWRSLVACLVADGLFMQGEPIHSPG